MIAMGLGNPSSNDVKERASKFDYYTRLLLEVKISVEYLHKPHSYFKSLLKEEQLKLLFYEQWNREKDLAEQKKIEAEININKNRSGIK